MPQKGICTRPDVIALYRAWNLPRCQHGRLKPLDFGLYSQTYGWLLVADNIRLILQKSATSIERRHDCKQHRSSEHHPHKEHEIASALQFYRAIRILNDPV